MVGSGKTLYCHSIKFSIFHRIRRKPKRVLSEWFLKHASVYAGNVINIQRIAEILVAGPRPFLSDEKPIEPAGYFNNENSNRAYTTPLFAGIYRYTLVHECICVCVCVCMCVFPLNVIYYIIGIIQGIYGPLGWNLIFGSHFSHLPSPSPSTTIGILQWVLRDDDDDNDGMTE